MKEEKTYAHPKLSEDLQMFCVENRGQQAGGRRRAVSDVGKDEQYWEKRRRNNEAAKRSREKRRLNDMATEAKLLELSEENSLLKNELKTIRNMLPYTGHSPLAATLSAPAAPTLPNNVRPLLSRLGSYPTENLPTHPVWTSGRSDSPVLSQIYPAKITDLANLFSYSYLSPYTSCSDSLLLHNLASTDMGSQKNLADHLSYAASPILSAKAWDVDWDRFNDSRQYLRTKLLERQIVYPNLSSADSQEGFLTGIGLDAPKWSLKKCLGDMAIGLSNGDEDTRAERPYPYAPSAGDGDAPSKRLRSDSGDISSTRSSSSENYSMNGVEACSEKPSEKGDDRNREIYDRYMERRRRNNEAAKRCRANRRALFESRYKRVQELERENARIRAQAIKLNRELAQLRTCMAQRVAEQDGLKVQKCQRALTEAVSFDLVEPDSPTSFHPLQSEDNSKPISNRTIPLCSVTKQEQRTIA